MNEQDVVRNKAAETPVGINTAGSTNDAKAMFDSIAGRAYELFEAQGRMQGRHMEHWLQAEKELFDRPPLMMGESGDGVTVLAEVSGFTPRELKVDVEPRRITIIGKHQTPVGSTEDGERIAKRSNRQLLQRLELPVEIDTHQVTSHLNKGVLELYMKKAVRTKGNQAQAGPAGQMV